jgi:hypothetical protein
MDFARAHGVENHFGLQSLEGVSLETEASEEAEDGRASASGDVFDWNSWKEQRRCE